MTGSVSNLPRWDSERALEHLDGSLDDLKALLEIFLRQAPRLLTDIRNAVENGDGQKLAVAAHTFRGSLQIVCANEALLLAEALEATGDSGQTADAISLAPKLVAEIELITQQVTVFMATH